MVVNTCKSSANKANGLQLFLHFLENAFRMDGNILPTVVSTCKCLRMAYQHYDCLTNALLIPSNFNANTAFSAKECSFGSHNGVLVTFSLS